MLRHSPLKSNFEAKNMSEQKFPIVGRHEWYGEGPLLNNDVEKSVIKALEEAGDRGLNTGELLEKVQKGGGLYSGIDTVYPDEPIYDVDDVQEAYLRLENHGIIEQDKETKLWRIRQQSV